MTHLSEPTQSDAAESDRLSYLERDRWPEFERELYLRRPRRIRFSLSQYRAEERPRWGWMISRCRTWDEVERVLNRHHVEWRRERGEVTLEGAAIFRCR